MTPLQLVSIEGIGVLDPQSLIPNPRSISLRTAGVHEAAAIHELITEHLAEGHLLPRDLGEIVVHTHRFVVAVQGDTVLACAELAPLSRSVAEVRSLVVSREARSLGVGRRMLDELLHRASTAGFDKLCAFTHAPGYFIQMGFSIVPHLWLPEKVFTDCVRCPHFRQCGQYAMVVPVTPVEPEFDPDRDRPADAYGDARGRAASAPRYA